jgi:dipeptidyl aminopeptidase/acylaminoacyl peptidase
MPKRPIRIDDLLKITYVGDPQISPDGDRVLFTRKTINEKNKYITHLFTVDEDGTTTQWTQGDGGAGHGRWSPDGHTIAFISGRDKPSSQLFLISTTGGEARKLSSLPEGSLGGFCWSPDGKHIAFTFRERNPLLTEAAKKEREEKGLSTPPIEIDDIWYRLDGDGYFANQRFKLYVLDVSSGEHTLLADFSTLGSYDYDWSPNSQELAVITSESKRPFVDPPNDQIYRITLDGQRWALDGLPKGDKSAVRWSPDGKWIAYAGDVDEADPWGVRNTKLYLVPAEGGAAKDLTGHTDYDLGVGTLSDTAESSFGAPIRWAPDGSGLYTSIGWHGETQIAFISTDATVELLTEGHHQVNFGNVSQDGRKFAALYGNATRLPEIAVVQAELKTGRLAPKVLTSFNHELLNEVKISEPEEFWVESTDGSKVHGWVIKPTETHEPRRSPAILEVHGGPHAQYGWAFFHEFQVLAAEGYVVVYTNPRGSKGYGEAYCSAIRGHWGTKDWDDIQAATRWMREQPFIQPGQMGVMGGSYGGYMTNWVIGHTNEFKAAITDRCVSNMVSMAGNSDFPFNKNGYFQGVAWGDLDQIKILWEQSPIAYFENVTTPTLILHSEGDLRCNIEQSEQVFTALQQQGVDSRFVRYPSSTSHGMSRSGPLDLRMHRLNEITSWMGKYLKREA